MSFITAIKTVARKVKDIALWPFKKINQALTFAQERIPGAKYIKTGAKWYSLGMLMGIVISFGLIVVQYGMAGVGIFFSVLPIVLICTMLSPTELLFAVGFIYLLSVLGCLIERLIKVSAFEVSKSIQREEVLVGTL